MSQDYSLKETRARTKLDELGACFDNILFDSDSEYFNILDEKCKDALASVKEIDFDINLTYTVNVSFNKDGNKVKIDSKSSINEGPKGLRIAKYVREY